MRKSLMLLWLPSKAVLRPPAAATFLHPPADACPPDPPGGLPGGFGAMILDHDLRGSHPHTIHAPTSEAAAGRYCVGILVAAVKNPPNIGEGIIHRKLLAGVFLETHVAVQVEHVRATGHMVEK